MVKCNPRSPATLQRGKGELHAWFGAEIPVGFDASDLAPSFRRGPKSWKSLRYFS
jgi:hypothetical protein